MITPKQQQLLLFIHRYMNKYGIAPSFLEMQEAMHFSSKSNIHRLISALEERGYIRRRRNRARALEITRVPHVVSALAEATSDAQLPLAPPVEANKKEEINVPFLGTLSVSTPLENICAPLWSISLPRELYKNSSYTAFKIEGSWLDHAGIRNGDITIIKEDNKAEPQQLIFASIDNCYATIKIYQPHGNMIKLLSPNPDYETEIYSKERVKINGILAGLFRKYL